MFEIINNLYLNLNNIIVITQNKEIMTFPDYSIEKFSLIIVQK